MNHLIDIHSFKTRTGEIGTDGYLGYGEYIISLDPVFKDWKTLGICGHSEISLFCREPIMLCGGLNGTAISYDRSLRIRFYLDEIPFGESAYPQQMTNRIVLSKGLHVLRTKQIDPAPDLGLMFGMRDTLAHTVWAFKKGEEKATRQNTLFVSAAAFGADTPEQTKLFRESAEEQHIPLEFYDSGKEFCTFFEHKIKNFLLNLQEWKAQGIEYIFSLDCRDIVFRHPVHIILGKFNALYSVSLMHFTMVV